MKPGLWFLLFNPVANNIRGGFFLGKSWLKIAFLKFNPYTREKVNDADVREKSDLELFYSPGEALSEGPHTLKLTCDSGL